jgi:hypothetical protein
MHIFLTSALVGGEWSALRPGRFTPGERTPGTHWIGGSVGSRAGLDDVEKRKSLILPGLELLPLSRPSHSQSLHELASPASPISLLLKAKFVRINYSVTLGLVIFCWVASETSEQLLAYLWH